MASLVAYFDESGTHRQSKVVVVAGFVAPESNWEAFASLWEKLLAEYGLDSFHMNAFENRFGKFKKMTEEKRQEIHRRLLFAINSSLLQGVAIAVSRSAYDDVYTVRGQGPKARKLIQSPYSFCALACVTRAIMWSQQQGNTKPIATIFEHGAGPGEIINAHRALRGRLPLWRDGWGALTFETRDMHLPLQAADILAYNSYKEAVNIVEGLPRARRYPTLQLARTPIQFIYSDKQQLLQGAGMGALMMAHEGLVEGPVKIDIEYELG